MADIVRIDQRSAECHPREMIGAKAANLARIAALGLPVPPAFVLAIDLCAATLAGDPDADRRVLDALKEGIAFLENATGTRFGDRRRPLLVSVRSGAACSMPGMLDTVLNVGCTADAVHGLIRRTGNPRFAWDCRRRLLVDFAETVAGFDAAPFAMRLNELSVGEGAQSETDLDGEALERLAAAYMALIEAKHDELSEDPMQQLARAVRAVFRSWTSERAQTYRRLQKLEHLAGTAVTVQAMVFGNGGLCSGAGVAFSRDPSTGLARPLIEVAIGSQGEDVVSGRRTPDPEGAIARSLPTVASDLPAVLERLEREFRDVQDVEFTIENGRLWILQTRTATRTPRAALRIAVDLVREGLITPEEGLQRLDGLDLEALGQCQLLNPGAAMIGGVAASSGIAVGRAAFESASAERLARAGDPVILVRPDTSTADIAGFAAAAGIVTAIGGRTAHAALVARQMGKPCIVGCHGIVVDAAARRAQIGTATVTEGEWLSIDGDTGSIHLGRHEIAVERPHAEIAEVGRWRAAAALHLLSA
jgi:pyruvate,orthophosphate dikinase